MRLVAIAEDFAKRVDDAATPDALVEALNFISHEMGFRYYALTHHVDLPRARRPAIRLHNYPQRWADYFDENRLGPSDPVHRASHLTSAGFAWARLPRLIALTPRDRDIMVRASREGIGNGFTVPAHVPGEACGSCSFATDEGRPVPSHLLPLAQIAGSFAFEGARRIWRMRERPSPTIPCLTDRQRECVFWAARGKSDWEIARILEVSHETVIRHLKQARERYGVGKRTQLTVHALFDGTLSFVDVLKR